MPPVTCQPATPQLSTLAPCVERTRQSLQSSLPSLQQVHMPQPRLTLQLAQQDQDRALLVRDQGRVPKRPPMLSLVRMQHQITVLLVQGPARTHKRPPMLPRVPTPAPAPLTALPPPAPPTPPSTRYKEPAVTAPSLHPCLPASARAWAAQRALAFRHRSRSRATVPLDATALT